MKKKIILIVVITIAITGIFYYLLNSYLRGYRHRMQEDFGFRVDNVKLEKIIENEFWETPSGDGYRLIVLKYDRLDMRCITQKFVPLPIKEDLQPNHIPQKYQSCLNGYYMFIGDYSDFKILIIDTSQKEICMYYGEM